MPTPNEIRRFELSKQLETGAIFTTGFFAGALFTMVFWPIIFFWVMGGL
jgi:hypothetical protein